MLATRILHLPGVLLAVMAAAANAAPALPEASLPSQGAADASRGLSPEADDLLFASPTRLDHVGRIVAPVMIDGKGPFRFIVDTGANRSTVSPQLARTLGLEPALDALLEVHGITGSAQVPSVQIHRLEAGALVILDTRFPVLWEPLMAGADGILGVAGLTGKRISVDFLHNQVLISHSTGFAIPPGYDRIAARRLEGGLLVVAARVGGVRVDAVIDTGSARSIANAALRGALAWRRRRGEVAAVTQVIGATTAVAPGQLEVAPTIDLGPVKVSNVTLVYGDFHIFEVWGMQSRPAVIIGMDVLGTVRGFAIDFRRSELYIDSAFHMG
jgi:predicted aspartyl protease